MSVTQCFSSSCCLNIDDLLRPNYSSSESSSEKKITQIAITSLITFSSMHLSSFKNICG